MKLCGKGGLKSERVREDGGHQWKRYFKHKKTIIYVNAYRLIQHALNLDRSLPVNALVLKTEVMKKFPFLTHIFYWELLANKHLVLSKRTPQRK